MTIPIDLDPVVFSLVGVDVRWYGLTAFAVVGIAWLVALGWPAGQPRLAQVRP